MSIQENVPLSQLTSMRTGGLARYVITVASKDDVRRAFEFIKAERLPWFVLGGGSNVIANGDFDGIIVRNQIEGIDQLDNATFRIGAGEIWDDVVDKICQLGLSGIECMSLIPGLAGSTPVQNVGAYGQEISDTLIELTAYDTRLDKFVTLSNSDCQFSYRHSIFKERQNRHYIICNLVLKLKSTWLEPPFYPSLQHELDRLGITEYSPANLRDAVIKVRISKLPDPKTIPSAGSFFKNPIVSTEKANKLTKLYPDMPHWQLDNNQTKLAAGWLIDKTGLKGFQNHGFQLYPQNALVITNINNGSSQDLELFKQEIVTKVQDKFGITLEQEPETL